MRDPPGEEKTNAGLRKVFRTKSSGGKIISDMVDRHDDDDETPKPVDRINSLHLLKLIVQVLAGLITLQT